MVNPFSLIPKRSNADIGLVNASWWNKIRDVLIAAFPSGGPIVTGTRAEPEEITAAGGITSNGGLEELQFIKGSGGAVDVSKDPQVSIGTNVGQILKLVGRDNANTVTLEDGTGLSLNGTCILTADSVLSLFWDGTNWVEQFRDIKG